MPNLSNTLARALAVAGFALVTAPAQAASVTVDAGAACTAFSWNPATSTLSCQVSTDCVVTGPNSAVLGSDVTLTASCPTSTTITWTGNDGASGCSGATCVVNRASGTGNQTYTATGNSSAAGNKVVNWTNSGVVPSGCSLTANPTSGAAGGSTTLTADCTTGTDPVTIAWTGTGTGSCPTTLNVSGSAVTCSVSNIQATTSFSASFSNAVGNATSPNNPRTATYTVQSGGGGDFASCPSGTITVAHTSQVWGNANINTWNHGDFGDGQIISFQIIPDAATAVKNSTWATGGGGGGGRDFSLTTQACDFSGATAINGSYGGKINGNSTTPQFYYRAGTTVGSPYGTNLVIGQKYYLNFRNPAGTCPSGNCILLGGLPK